MKKQQIAAAACLVAGAIGFAAVYSTQKPGKDEIPTEISQTSSIVEPTEKKTPQKTTEKVDSETKMGQEESAAGQQENQQPTEKQLHFVPENVTNWPVKGDVLLPFSMDKTVYFPTLDQYQKNAIATKITSKVKTTVQQSVNSSMVSTITKIASKSGELIVGDGKSGDNLAGTVVDKLKDMDTTASPFHKRSDT